MGELYRNCDLDTVVNFLAKQVSYPLRKTKRTFFLTQTISECFQADRIEPEGYERRIDATVRYHTRLL